MQSDTTQTVLLIPADLGPVENYDPTVPLGRITSLRAGGLYLRATVDEMLQIIRLCEGLEENHRELLRDTKAQYDNLNRQKKELELLEKSQSILKPFKLIAIKRAKRAFLESTQELWTSTRTTSERLKRALLSTPAANLAPVERGSVRRDNFSGLAVPLSPPPPGETNPPGIQEAIAAAQKMASILISSGMAFADPAPSNNPDRETSTEGAALDPEVLSSARSSSISTSPSSPGSASSFGCSININIVSNTDSNVPGLTIHNNGSENSGSIIHHRPTVNSSPS